MNESLVQGLEACHLLSWIIKINSVSKSLSRDGTERYEIAKILMLFQILTQFLKYPDSLRFTTSFTRHRNTLQNSLHNER